MYLTIALITGMFIGALLVVLTIEAIDLWDKWQEIKEWENDAN